MSDSPMKVKSGGSSSREPIPVGNHAARSVIVAGIGEQESQYGVKPEVIISWDLPKLPPVEWEDDDGTKHSGPQRISGFYNLTLGTADKPSNLRKILVGWRGREFTEEEEAGFDLAKVAGVCCYLTVQHKAKKSGGTSDVVAAAVPMTKEEVGMMDPPSMEPVYYDAWNHDPEQYERLPEWIQKRVNIPGGAPEAPADVTPEEEDDIPF